MRNKWLVAVIYLLSLPALAGNTAKARAANPEVAATLHDVQETLGIVPAFIKAVPDAAVPGAWEEMKGLELNPDTAIPPKYKELIGLAVAAQIPCQYCVYAHTHFAKLNGATDEEIKTAIVESALTRHWSTFLNGVIPDEAAFKAEVDQAVEAMKTAMAAPPGSQPPAPPITDADSALKDAKISMGGVLPTFIKLFPPEGLVGAWREEKAIELSPGPIPDKYLSLISLAVASQIPCRYCVIYDTAFAMQLAGATDRERYEAIGMAAVTRHWSTFLNGIEMNGDVFRKDIDGIVAKAKERMAAAKAKPQTR